MAKIYRGDIYLLGLIYSYVANNEKLLVSEDSLESYYKSVLKMVNKLDKDLYAIYNTLTYETSKPFYLRKRNSEGRVCYNLIEDVDYKKIFDLLVLNLPLEILICTIENKALKHLNLEIVDSKLIAKDNMTRVKKKSEEK